MAPKPILYGIAVSTPVRAVLFTLAALDVDYELKPINVYAGKSEELLKKNPQHTIPTLEDEAGNCIWDSHAIMAYLARKYGKNDSLYPKDFYGRAVVDQRLHFESNVSGGLKSKFLPIFKGDAKKAQLTDLVQSIEDDVYRLLEIFLADNKFLAGKALTIADFSILSSVQSMSMFAPIDAKKFPKVAAWFNSMKQLPYYNAVSGEPIKIMANQVVSTIATLK